MHRKICVVRARVRRQIRHAAPPHRTSCERERCAANMCDDVIDAHTRRRRMYTRRIVVTDRRDDATTFIVVCGGELRARLCAVPMQKYTTGTRAETMCVRAAIVLALPENLANRSEPRLSISLVHTYTAPLHNVPPVIRIDFWSKRVVRSTHEYL